MNWKPKTLINIGFLIRTMNSFYNGFIGTSIGANADSLSFHYRAANPWYNQENRELFNGLLIDGGQLYIQILEIIYDLTIDHLFISSFVSSVFWYFSALVLLKSCNILNINQKSQKKIFFLYSFLPSSILYTSIPLRESFQLLFVNIIFYAFVLIYHKNKKNIGYWLLAILSIYMVGAFHYALLYSGIVGFFLFTTSIFLKKVKSKIVVIPIILVLSFLSFYSISSLFNNVYQLELAEQVVKYQMGLINVENARAIYRASIELDKFSSLLLFIPVSLFQYLFEPLPQRVSNIMDIFLLFENLIRMFLIYNAVVSIKKMKNAQFAVTVFLFYLAIEMIWSLGVNNWGTASRHHIPSWGLLCIASYIIPNAHSSKKNLNV
jgi:hypothetical protein